MELDDDGKPYSVTYGKCFSRNICHLIEQALRIAGEAEGAPARCHKRACRRSGDCHLTVNRDGDGHCGAGISDAMMDKAGLMLYFVAHIGIMARDVPPSHRVEEGGRARH
jgi:hypothetical protein